MCQSRIDPKEYAFARGLHARGIPLDEEELERMKFACLGLSIDGDGPSIAFNLPSGGAGYVFSVEIRNVSKQRLSLEHIGFDGLEWESKMQLLPDPQKANPMRFYNPHQYPHVREGELNYLVAREVYAFQGLQLHRYPRDAVLNHRIGRGRVLFPGDFADGLLLAVGETPIPWEYADGDRLKVRLTVYSQRGSHVASFRPAVERSREEKRLMEKLALPNWTRIPEKQLPSAALLASSETPASCK